MDEPMKQLPFHAKSACVQDWEQAGTFLGNAASRYFDLSKLLESHCTTVDGSSSDLVTHIDASLRFLQTTVDLQLTGARIALANARNNLARVTSILRLPGEVLSQIFLTFVYDPYGTNRYFPVTAMVDRIELIYQRVHTLLAVCTTWRNTALACGALWSVVPFVDPIVGRPRVQSTELSLQRASAGELHLAFAHPYLPKYPYPRLDPLDDHTHRFSSVNILCTSTDAFEIDEVLGRIIEDEKPNTLSKLSLKRVFNSSGQSGVTYEEYAPSEPRFPEIIKSLSALRMSCITIDWKITSFSPALAELWLENVALRRREVNPFFDALSLAHELRDLKLINFVVEYDRHSPPLPAPISFSKLESLHLENIHFNVLQLLFTILPPGSHRLALNPREHIFTKHPSDHFVEPEDVFLLLRRTSVHKLILTTEGGWWESVADMPGLLASIPALKSLILNFYEIDQALLKSLVPSPKQPSSKPNLRNQFPRLDTLEIYAATFLSELRSLKTDFDAILDYHPIQRMVLGGKTQLSAGATPLDEGDEAVGWLKARVSRFYLAPDPEEAPEDQSKWELWDV